MWCWSKLSSAQWEDVWSERLAGNPNAVITYIKGGKSIRVEVYCELEEDAEFLRSYFGGRVRESKSQDWMAAQNRMKRPPIKVRNKLLVTESTNEEHIQDLRNQFPGRKILSIPAEMAFGTGDHATTATCMRLIADYAKEHRGELWHMLDLGCGTGILALAARVLGADAAAGMDFDSVAVDVSRSNARRNQHEEVIFFEADVFQWKPERGQVWDLVVANLFSSILQKAFPRITRMMSSNGTLIVSGILATQWEETLSAAQEAGLDFCQVIRKGKWITARGGRIR